MDRLTKPGHKFDLLNIMQGLTKYTEIDEILTRLAAYENTGLTPEEITALAAERDTYKAALQNWHEDGVYATEEDRPCREDI